MELGELANVSMISFSDGPCPFCESKGDKKKPTLEVTNDSRKLGENTSGVGRIGKSITHPTGEELEIWEDYWRNDETSAVANNAHHIIPGNAVFAKANELHKWMAWKVTVKKAWYSKTETKAVNTATTEKKDIGTVTVTTTRTVTHETLGGRKRIEREITTSGNKVYGLVEYDVNCSANGVWLPSNNAIYGWGKHSLRWQKAYAKAAMIAHGYQFHDAHPQYSDSVKSELLDIATKVEQSSEGCMAGCDDPDKDPIPAPQQLLAVLNKLSSLIRDKKLKLKPGKKVEPSWSTSSLATGFKLPRKK